jgi:hypothetical protein
VTSPYNSGDGIGVWGGMEYIDAAKEYPRLTKHQKVSSDKFQEKFHRLGIPIAVCRHTKRGQIDTEVVANYKGTKSVWVPLKLWNAAKAGRKIVRDDIPPLPNLVRADGYVNLNMLASLCKRRIHDLMRSSPFKAFVRILAADTGVDVMVVRDTTRWVHPRLSDWVAFTSDAAFAVAATAWIDKAKELIAGVATEHWNALNDFADRAASRDQREARVRDRLQHEIGGSVEVVGDGIRLDLVTEAEIIEVKHAINLTVAAQAIGQVGMYALTFPSPNKTPRVHLFGSIEEIEAVRSSNIERLASMNKVRLTYETVE